MPIPIALDGQSLTIADVIAVARDRAPVSLQPDARDRLSRIEVDWLRVKPIVKVTGEFFAQTAACGDRQRRW